jgi:hypothetical protein
MKYARIDLSKTDYTQLPNSKLITEPNPIELERIYNTYCVYKKFKSVMPIFEEEYTDPRNDVIGYYDNNQLVAFSLIRKYDKENCEAVQFAWDYVNPKLQLGYSSLKSECAYYRAQGFCYYYLGGADEYKRQFDGFEILGPRT